MPYLRKLGSQLLILHGSRPAGTRNVSQRTLFAIRSRDEALAIAGSGEGAVRFQSLMAHAYPMVRFSWSNLCAGIRARASELPETAEYRQERLLNRFRSDLVAFTRQLAVADPQLLLSHADAIRSHRDELEYLRDLISWRLRLCEPQEEHEFNRDDRFFWRATLNDDDLPADAIEGFEAIVEKGPPARALKIGALLLDAFPGWVGGHQWLGDICAETDDFDSAERHFLACLDASKPRLMREHGKLPWACLENRPYIRSLRGLCGIHAQRGRYDDVLATCTRLVKEASDVESASTYRALAFLCRGQWPLAADAALQVRRVDPTLSVVHALASAESGDVPAARVSAIHGILNLPRAVSMLLKERVAPPGRSRSETSDHNAGVWLRRMIRPYLASHRKGPALLREIRQERRVAETLAALREAVRRWESGDGEQLQTVGRLRALEHARELEDRPQGSAAAGMNVIGLRSRRRAKA